MAVVSMKSLLESGVHFGHRTNRWNPKMKPYIFTERNGIHIIDLQQTVRALNEVYNLTSQTVAAGGEILFVGTKRQAQETIAEEATRCGMPFVNERWLGGSLTNWPTIQQRIRELERLLGMQASGEVERLTKKEGLMIQRQIDRLQYRLSGLVTMKRVPQLLFVVDISREQAAVHEANLLNIPVIAMVDTNCDPRNIDYVIPSNDDAIRAIKLLVGTMANAVLEGKAAREDENEAIEAMAEMNVVAAKPKKSKTPEKDVADMSDEELLGAATLAKMSAEREAVEEKAAQAEEAPAAVAEAASEEAAPQEEAAATDETTETPESKEDAA